MRVFKQMRPVSVAALAAATAVAVLTAVSGAGASTPGPSNQQQNDIVVYGHQDPLPGAETIVESGVIRAGECYLEGSLKGPGGKPGAIVQRITKVDQTRCEITLERLEIPLDELDKYDPSAAVGTSQANAAAGSVSSDFAGIGSRATVNHYVGSIKFNWEDPLQIDVTTTKSSVNWSQNQGSSCLAGASFNALWGWYSPTGWQRDTASWQHDFACDYASVNTFGTFHNSVFCWPGTTNTDHYNTFFSGKPGGAWYAQWGAGKSGACANLLSPEHIIVHP